MATNNLSLTKIYSCYSDEVNGKWKLTTIIEEARNVDPNYKLASLDELNDWACLGEVFEGWIHTIDGFVKWIDNEKEDIHGYVLVDKLK